MADAIAPHIDNLIRLANPDELYGPKITRKFMAMADSNHDNLYGMRTEPDEDDAAAATVDASADIIADSVAFYQEFSTEIGRGIFGPYFTNPPFPANHIHQCAPHHPLLQRCFPHPHNDYTISNNEDKTVAFIKEVSWLKASIEERITFDEIVNDNAAIPGKIARCNVLIIENGRNDDHDINYYLRDQVRRTKLATAVNTALGGRQQFYVFDATRGIVGKINEDFRNSYLLYIPQSVFDSAGASYRKFGNGSHYEFPTRPDHIDEEKRMNTNEQAYQDANAEQIFVSPNNVYTYDNNIRVEYQNINFNSANPHGFRVNIKYNGNSIGTSQLTLAMPKGPSQSYLLHLAMTNIVTPEGNPIQPSSNCIDIGNRLAEAIAAYNNAADADKSIFITILKKLCLDLKREGDWDNLFAALIMHLEYGTVVFVSGDRLAILIARLLDMVCIFKYNTKMIIYKSQFRGITLAQQQALQARHQEFERNRVITDLIPYLPMIHTIMNPHFVARLNVFIHEFSVAITRRRSEIFNRPIDHLSKILLSNRADEIRSYLNAIEVVSMGCTGWYETYNQILERSIIFSNSNNGGPDFEQLSTLLHEHIIFLESFITNFLYACNINDTIEQRTRLKDIVYQFMDFVPINTTLKCMNYPTLNFREEQYKLLSAQVENIRLMCRKTRAPTNFVEMANKYNSQLETIALSFFSPIDLDGYRINRDNALTKDGIKARIDFLFPQIDSSGRRGGAHSQKHHHVILKYSPLHKMYDVVRPAVTPQRATHQRGKTKRGKTKSGKTRWTTPRRGKLQMGKIVNYVKRNILKNLKNINISKQLPLPFHMKYTSKEMWEQTYGPLPIHSDEVIMKDSPEDEQKNNAYEWTELIKDIASEAAATVNAIYRELYPVDAFITQCQHASSMIGKMERLRPVLEKQIIQTIDSVPQLEPVRAVIKANGDVIAAASSLPRPDQSLLPIHTETLEKEYDRICMEWNTHSFILDPHFRNDVDKVFLMDDEIPKAMMILARLNDRIESSTESIMSRFPDQATQDDADQLYSQYMRIKSTFTAAASSSVAIEMSGSSSKKRQSQARKRKSKRSNWLTQKHHAK